MANSEHLLAILPFPEPVDWVARLRQKHPALKITWVYQSYGITTWDAKNQVDPGTCASPVSLSHTHSLLSARAAN